MSSDYRPDIPDPPNDKDDEIVALSKALKDQVRELKQRVRAQGVKSEPPSFAPEGKAPGKAPSDDDPP